ncbi:MAG: fibronectin type III domain-containing protein, partial [Dolichospermum sp.]
MFDNLRVRKYTPTEPTVSLGNSIKAIDVAFGNNSTLFNLVDSQTIRGYTPAGTGNVNIKVTNSDGSNGTSSTNLYTYGNNNVPNPIFDLAVTATEGGTISLGWTAPFDNGSPITNYLIRYSQNNFSTYTDFNTQSTNNSTTVTGLNVGQSYQFKVIAKNSSIQN